jgi:hypothetical protein
MGGSPLTTRDCFLSGDEIMTRESFWDFRERMGAMVHPPGSSGILGDPGQLAGDPGDQDQDQGNQDQDQDHIEEFEYWANQDSGDQADRDQDQGEGGPGAGGAAARTRLESIEIKSTFSPKERILVSGCSCGARTCPNCGKRLGWRVRQNMLAQKDFWRKPGLFTLTVDRSKFGSAKEAHGAITEGQFVRRLLYRLGVRRWAWALEFQQKTGEGWPHWHVLVDLADLPGGKLDLVKAWRLWRYKWDLGGLDLQAKKVKLASAAHAVFYLTKYICKQAPGGYPVWVLEQHGLRFIQGCQKLGPLTAERRPVKAKIEEEDKRQYPKRRPLIDRQAMCR